ncbi:hypothetical protein SADUNF_Sadunf17G0120800 [Salix dunnii]|uniref:Uncharacterized protein n=1 Tax=Salix dunnii TaxID=1413687 RepID=A0A835J3X7_9ROSI|nr:hypothetical protein SADUNF_Sadunf17G0120800 [Salix dunnii]
MVAEKNMGLYFNIKKTLLKAFDLVDFADADEKNMELLDFLYTGFDINDWGDMMQAPLYAKLMENEDENGSTQSTVSVEKGLVEEFKQMAERLESVDEQPEEELLEHRAKFISEAWESISTLMLIALLQCHEHQPHCNLLGHLVLEDGVGMKTLLVKASHQPLLCRLLCAASRTVVLTKMEANAAVRMMNMMMVKKSSRVWLVLGSWTKLLSVPLSSLWIFLLMIQQRTERNLSPQSYAVPSRGQVLPAVRTSQR